MESAYFSAIAALAGSTIGGMTSLATSWLTQRAQHSAQLRSDDLHMRQELYRRFIEEASKRYVDAFAHSEADVVNLVNLYVLVSRMRVISSEAVVESADKVVRAIIERYLAPNKNMEDALEILDHTDLNPLHDFSGMCRNELRRLGAVD